MSDDSYATRGGLVWAPTLKNISCQWGEGFTPQRKYNVLVYLCNRTPFDGTPLRVIRAALEYGRVVHAYFNGVDQEELEAFKSFVVANMYEAKERLFVHQLPAVVDSPHVRGLFIDRLVADIKISPVNTPRFCNVGVLVDNQSAYAGMYDSLFPTWAQIPVAHRSLTGRVDAPAPKMALTVPETHLFTELDADGNARHYDMIQVADFLGVSLPLIAKRRQRGQFPEPDTRINVSMAWSGATLNKWLRANNFIVRLASGGDMKSPRQPLTA